MDGKKESRYQLRRAAGVCWLIDMEQKGVPFQKPIPVNEMGAEIWELLVCGQRDRIVEKLCEEYQIERVEVIQDVEYFIKDLEKHGIFI